ncbi:MAG: saccharopine dehydrogenase NADP-binding domain-containing protein [Myxococcota bacterium]
MTIYAILGATGSVGETCAHRLATHAAATGATVRLGGRNRARLEELAAKLSGRVEIQPTDLTSDADLAAFCAGVRVVANCAGPSYAHLDRVARAAWAAEADFVDIGGELAAVEKLKGLQSTPAPQLDRRTAIFSAGVMPGLSGLLPRLLCQAGELRRLDSYVGGAQIFTTMSAVDGLLTRGDQFGTPSAIASHGEVLTGRLAPLHDVSLPCFPKPVHAWPYLTTEAQELSRAEGIADVRAYNVFVTNRLPEAMADAWAHLGAEAQIDDVWREAEAVVKAADEDKADHGQFYVMLFTARPAKGAVPGPSRLALRATDSYAVSGVVMAEAARQVADGLPPGVRLAARALDPQRMLQTLQTDPHIESIEIG